MSSIEDEGGGDDTNKADSDKDFDNTKLRVDEIGGGGGGGGGCRDVSGVEGSEENVSDTD